MKSKLWKIKEENMADFSFASPVNSLLEKMLKSRCTSLQEAEEFLSEREILNDPTLLPDIEKAVSRVSEAIEQGEKICIYGDYDCDGVCATAILVDYLQNVGGRVFYYIPHREKEGYGMNKNAVDFIKSQGASLIITVDNGITAMEEISYAASLGMDTVVTDHHTPRDVLPKSAANVNPHIKGCEYPFKNICGAMVAFKLICAMEGEQGFFLLEQYADLLAIATIGDIMELRNENRFVVKKGIEFIKEGRREGITSLLEKAGITDLSTVNSETLSFALCPRINAAGRMDSADFPVMLFLSESREEMEELSSHLDSLNSKRKEEESGIINEIKDQFAKNPNLLKDRIMVLEGRNWNPGVVGIVASRLTERFSRPVLIAADDGSSSKGSGRSIEGFSLIDAITASSAPLTHFGGHPMAAGFSLPSEKIGEFRRLLNNYEQGNRLPPCYLNIDFKVEPCDLTCENVESLHILEPFGTGNPSAVMFMENAEIIRKTALSGGKHTKYLIKKDNRQYNLLCFNLSSDSSEAVVGDFIDCAFSPSINEWGKEKNVDLIMISMRPSGSDYEDIYKAERYYEEFKEGEDIPFEFCPQRNETALLYRFLKVRPINFKSPDWEYERCKSRLNLSFIKFLLSIDILKELGTIKEDDSGFSYVIPNAPKCDFKSSLTVRRFS